MSNDGQLQTELRLLASISFCCGYLLRYAVVLRSGSYLSGCAWTCSSKTGTPGTRCLGLQGIGKGKGKDRMTALFGFLMHDDDYEL